jgi:predicted ATPase
VIGKQPWLGCSRPLINYEAMKESTAPLRFVIAGGPGSGKSTLLRALAEAGERCYEECSRAIIREQLARGGDRVPWGDLPAFAEECGTRMLAQIRDSAHPGRHFMDRGLPDLIGYLTHAGLGIPEAWRMASSAYASHVFFAPPWQDIFVNDAERPQSFADALALSTHIRRAYLDCGFRLVELVRASVDERIRQILGFLEDQPSSSS